MLTSAPKLSLRVRVGDTESFDGEAASLAKVVRVETRIEDGGEIDANDVEEALLALFSLRACLCRKSSHWSVEADKPGVRHYQLSFLLPVLLPSDILVDVGPLPLTPAGPGTAPPKGVHRSKLYRYTAPLMMMVVPAEARPMLVKLHPLLSPACVTTLSRV